MSVKIDRYELKFEQSPKIIIFDNKLQMNIASVNTKDKENNVSPAASVRLWRTYHVPYGRQRSCCPIKPRVLPKHPLS